MIEGMQTVEIVFFNRVYLYALLGMILGEEPTTESLSYLLDAHTIEEIELLDNPLSVSIVDMLETLRCRSEEAVVDELGCDYTKHFIGPGSLPAPPWASVYLTGKPLLFQETTLAVRTFYREAGYLPVRYPHVADDHIAIELNFMCELAKESLTALQHTRLERVIETLEIQQRFLDKHLLTWISTYAQRISEENDSGFYAFAVSYAADFCLRDFDLISMLSAQLSIDG